MLECRSNRSLALGRDGSLTSSRSCSARATRSNERRNRARFGTGDRARTPSRAFRWRRLRTCSVKSSRQERYTQSSSRNESDLWPKKKRCDHCMGMRTCSSSEPQPRPAKPGRSGLRESGTPALEPVHLKIGKQRLAPIPNGRQAPLLLSGDDARRTWAADMAGGYALPLRKFADDLIAKRRDK